MPESHSNTPDQQPQARCVTCGHPPGTGLLRTHDGGTVTCPECRCHRIANEDNSPAGRAARIAAACLESTGKAKRPRYRRGQS